MDQKVVRIVCRMHRICRRRRVVSKAAGRTTFGATAVTVRGWPSSGGIVVHTSCNAVELDFLGLSRFSDTLSQRNTDAAAEDAFCDRLRKIGGRLFDTECASNEFFLRGTDLNQMEVFIGWPEGGMLEDGVWVLMLDREEMIEKGASRIKNAVTMNDRCKMIVKMGGTYHKDYKTVEPTLMRALRWTGSPGTRFDVNENTTTTST